MPMIDTITWAQDPDGIVLLTLDDPAGSVNTMNDAFCASIERVANRLLAHRGDVRGVVVTSKKTSFFAGGNLHDLHAVSRDTQAEFAAFLRSVKNSLRTIETFGRPVVAAINGAALGGGLELCLAAHRRVVVDDPTIEIGFPEVHFGILPGAGGLTRAVRMFGVSETMTNLLVRGQRLNPAQAIEIGLVDELVSRDQLIPSAKRWILDQDPEQFSGQPWDAVEYAVPGGTPTSPGFAAHLATLPATLRKHQRGAPYPAPRHILAAAVEGTQVDFANAIEIEERYLLDLVTGPIAKNMIRALFFERRDVIGRWKPELPVPIQNRVAVIGAGTMGAAIATISASAGFDVVLVGITDEATERGKAHCAKLVEAAAHGHRQTAAEGRAVLARITSTSDPATVVGADIVIESVLEDPAIKAEVMRRIEPHLAPDAIVASNTSSLSVTSLAEHVSRPANFIGMHFFAPVEQMELVEIVRGALTSDQTFARALDLARRLRRVPIVASDKPGFFTTRVIMTYIEEGLAMLVEGIPPSTIEQAAAQAGYPSPVLRLADDLGFEVLTAIDDILHRDGVSREASSSARVLARMLVELDRPGRHEGRGFYDYTDGLVPRLWPGLAETFESAAGGTTPSLEELKDRLLFVEALEAVRCLDDGVVSSVAEANIGSLLGIGYPSWTGGPLQYINSYPDGVAGFVHRSRELTNRYGPRFEPPDSLVARSEGAAP